MVKLPAPVLLAVAAILLPYLVQSRLGGEPNAMVDLLALVPADVARGRVWPLLTAIFVHGSWLHAIMNALGVMAFGTPVARWFGPRPLGRFLLFYDLCALASSLGYVAVHWGQAVVLVGASGAGYGLMGASSRLLDGRGALAPFASRTVLGMGGACLAINLLLAMNWIDAGQGGAPVAWEAHLFGYAAGLLLIGPFTPRRRGVAVPAV